MLGCACNLGRLLAAAESRQWASALLVRHQGHALTFSHHCLHTHSHTHRLPARAQEPDAQALLAELRSQGCFYATPPGSNDDWWVV